MGTLLVPTLRERGFDVVTVDLVPVSQSLQDLSLETVEASVLDHEAMDAVVLRHRPEMVFHLAAVLSAKAESEPRLAHHVNVDGTFELFRICINRGKQFGRPIRFIFPSSIAVYGLPDAETKVRQGAVSETEWTVPTGMYGCNKLYGELVGTFLARKPVDGQPSPLDFRSIRFPGLVSADTLPTSGTTDYAPAMIHAAVQDEPYACFVGEQTALPFMTMPDAVEALSMLAETDGSRLSTRVYNIKGFSATAGEIRDEVLRHYPNAAIRFDPIAEKQELADSWPADIDDARAREDWGLAPRHDLRTALSDYLIPALRERYGSAKRQSPAAD